MGLAPSAFIYEHLIAYNWHEAIHSRRQLFFFKGFGQVDKVLTNEGGFSKMSTLALSLSTVCLFLSQ